MSNVAKPHLLMGGTGTGSAAAWAMLIGSMPRVDRHRHELPACLGRAVWRVRARA